MTMIKKMLMVMALAGVILPCASALSDPPDPPAPDGQQQTKAGMIEGRAVLGDEPLEGALVYVAKDAKGIFNLTSPPAPGVFTGKDGGFSMELPEGTYYVALRKGKSEDSVEPGDIYCFYGGNPVSVESGHPVRIVLPASIKPEPATAMETAPETPAATQMAGDVSEPARGVVEGVVTLDGKPLKGASLEVYPGETRNFRAPSRGMPTTTGADGRFRMKLPEGSWYIIVRKRASGQTRGPVREGDYDGYADTNPVTVKKGSPVVLAIPVGKIVRVMPGGHDYAHISGVVVFEDGRPAPGMHVCLYKNEKMDGRPLLASEATRQDGSFSMDIPVAGKYYVGARSNFGGPPDEGEFWWGKYAGSPDHSITVKAGATVSGLEITVESREKKEGDGGGAPVERPGG